MKKSLLHTVITPVFLLLFALSVSVHAQTDFSNVDLFSDTNNSQSNSTTNGLLDVNTSLSNTATNTNTDTNSNTENNTAGPTNSNTGNNTDLQPTNSNTNNNNSKDNPKYLLTNPLGKTTNIQDVIVTVVKVVQILLMMAAVVYIIWAGFLFVSARGDTAKITKARNALLWGFVGVALVLGAQVIVTTIKNSVNSVFYDTTK